MIVSRFEALAGRTAVVTGASRGIGAAIAAALADAGANVVLAARTQEAIADLASTLRGRGLQAIPIPCDVSDPAAITALASGSNQRFGQVDILINNAGVASSAPLHRLQLDEWNRLLTVNATGTFLCTQAFAPAMAERGWGRVVNVASLAARAGARYIAGYAASKHAVLGFTRCIAAEMAAHGVTVNAVCPGFVDTDMTTTSIERIVDKTGLSPEQALESILATTPQRRLITPQEVAHVVIMLCDEQARGINGQAIGIDGGEFLG